ncbi:MAG TPA: porin PorA family protein, partial [Acidimicrobiales bacterium]|nr:porin PorA family protein [Acidimicrobiales bacterium]
MRRWAIVVGALGAVLLLGAATLRFVVVPRSKVLPADTNQVVVYAGTMTALNASALQAGDLANAFVRDLPVRVERTVKVLSTSGGKARVSDASVVKSAATGETLTTSANVYTLDRGSMAPVANFMDQPAEAASGDVVVGFPIGTGKHTYQGWVQETGKTTPLAFDGTTKRQGLDVYSFSGQHTAPLADPGAMGLPASIPKSQLGTLALAGNVSQDQAAALLPALATLPDDVPLTYTFATKGGYWVEPATGIVVDMKRADTINVAIKGLESVTMPVLNLDIAYTPDNVTSMVGDAKDARAQLALFGTTVPLALSVLGIIGLSLSVELFHVQRRRGAVREPLGRPVAA